MNRADERKAMIERVKKLLALGDKERNPSEAEAEAAFRRAQQLIEKHGLQLDELEFAEDPNLLDAKRFKRFDFTFGKKIVFQWERTLAQAVARATGTRVVLSWKDRLQVAAFVAHENDGDIALAMYASILSVAKSVQRQWLAERRGISGFSKLANDFLDGFSYAIWKRAADDADAHRAAQTAGSRTSLMVISKDDAALAAEKEMFPRAKKLPGRGSRVSEGYEAGLERGRNRVLGRGTLGNSSRRIGGGS